MKKLFEPKNNMWVAEKERLVERILVTIDNVPDTAPRRDYLEDKIYYLLDNYGVYRKPPKKLKSKTIFRLTAPLYYLVGTILFIILRPITYVFNISLVNTKIGYFMRAWENRL